MVGKGTPNARAVTLAAVVLAVLVTQIALANGGNGPTAAPSAGTKTLRKNLAALTRRVSALEGKPGPNIPASLPPSGAASGDLAGSYPSPTIAPGAVTPSKLAIGETQVTFANSGTLLQDDGAGGNPRTSTITTGQLPPGDYAAFAVANVNLSGGPQGRCFLQASTGTGSDLHSFLPPSVAADTRSLPLMFTTTLTSTGTFSLVCQILVGSSGTINLADREIIPIRLKSQVQEGVDAVNSD
jgi:hypothetical protein